MVTPTTGARADANCANVPVIVDNNCTGTTGLTLQGGVYLNGTLLPTASGVPYVTDLQLAHTADGQTIIVYYFTSEHDPQARHRRGEAVDQPDDRHAAVPQDHLHRCWGLLGHRHAVVAGLEQRRAQRRDRPAAVLRPLLPLCRRWPTPTGPPRSITALSTCTTAMSVRPAPPTDCAAGPSPRRARTASRGHGTSPRRRAERRTAAVTGWVDPSYAVYQNPGATTATGRRHAPDGGRRREHLHRRCVDSRVEPRGADLFFSDPIPGDASGASADDQLDVQNVLGVVFGGGSIGTGLGLTQGDLQLLAALTGDLQTHASPRGELGRSGPSQWAVQFRRPERHLPRHLDGRGRCGSEDHGDLRASRSLTPATRGTGSTTSAVPLSCAVAAGVPRLPEFHGGLGARHRQLQLAPGHLPVKRRGAVP